MKVEVDVLGSPSLTVRTGLCGRNATLNLTWFGFRAVQELCENRDGHLGFPVPNSPYRLCGRKPTFEEEHEVEEEASLA